MVMKHYPPEFKADAVALRWGEQHHAHARIDSEWLEGIVHQLEADPDLGKRGGWDDRGRPTRTR